MYNVCVDPAAGKHILPTCVMPPLKDNEKAQLEDLMSTLGTLTSQVQRERGGFPPRVHRGITDVHRLFAEIMDSPDGRTTNRMNTKEVAKSFDATIKDLRKLLEESA